MKRIGMLLCMVVAAFGLTQCGDDDSNKNAGGGTADDFIRAADMSFLPEIEQAGTVYYKDGQSEDALLTLKNAGVNTIRIRVWKNPANAHSGLAEVKAFAQRVKAQGMKVWLTVHYSDTWADPSAQVKPQEWESLSFNDLKAAAVTYTKQILTEVDPDIIQIGNETNDGFIYPEGNLTSNEGQYLQLVTAIGAAIRAQSPDAKIMLHHAGTEGAEWFYNKVANVDYDYIGLSYYPIWHGKDLAALQSSITALGTTHNKKVVIAETAYPFTLGYNDWTNNIMGDQSQLVPGYAASNDGQKYFLLAVRKLVEDSGVGAGFAYWGTEWVAFNGEQATNGSTFENQALWDFNNNALPALDAFEKDTE